MKRVAAVDLGASSGRVMLGSVGDGVLELSEIHRFWNGPVQVRDTLHWDILHLHRSMLEGLAQAGPLDSIGIDSWAVDYALLDSAGRLLGNPVHYRDARTDGVMERVLERVSAAELYEITGLQQLPFNTIYQLAAEADASAAPGPAGASAAPGPAGASAAPGPAGASAAPGPAGASNVRGMLGTAVKLLMIPDLLDYWLTGQAFGERTNASTTQLYDVRAREWSSELASRIGLPVELLPPLREPGDVIGTLLPTVAEETGLDASTPVIAVGSHDTASSVVAVPAANERFAYISSGTWSLVGLELEAPVLTAEAREANFTNEGGVDGRIRFLRNVMGLWILQECQRSWAADDLPTLLRDAADAPPFAVLIDPDAPEFLAPGNMPRRIEEHCRATGQEPPRSRAATVRCVLESLALAYRRTLRQAQTIADRPVDVLHVIGGGSQNELLCQLTADACGLPVLAGPVEASALGNVLVQARALGEPLPDLGAMRALVRTTHQLRRYEPQGKPADWDAAESRMFGSR